MPNFEKNFFCKFETIWGWNFDNEEDHGDIQWDLDLKKVKMKIIFQTLGEKWKKKSLFFDIAQK